MADAITIQSQRTPTAVVVGRIEPVGNTVQHVGFGNRNARAMRYSDRPINLDVIFMEGV